MQSRSPCARPRTLPPAGQLLGTANAARAQGDRDSKLRNLRALADHATAVCYTRPPQSDIDAAFAEWERLRAPAQGRLQLS